MTFWKISIQEDVHLENGIVWECERWKKLHTHTHTHTHIPICLPVADEVGRRSRRKKDNSQKATLFTTAVYVLIPKKIWDFKHT